MLSQGAASSLKQLLLGGTVLDYGLACWTLNASARACGLCWTLHSMASSMPMVALCLPAMQ